MRSDARRTHRCPSVGCAFPIALYFRPQSSSATCLISALFSSFTSSMPSLSTRRRRAGAGADASAGDLLEGGGSRGTAVTDTTTAATVERLRAFQAQNQAASVASTRAHLVAFPIFLFGVLALC